MTAPEPADGQTGPLVFVTYSHDTDDHKAQVRMLCDFLTTRGFRIILDQWVRDRQNWARWAEATMLNSDFILVVVSPEYRRRVDGEAADDVGWGARYEAHILRELVTRDYSRWVRRILPVLLPGHDVDEIPIFLQPYSVTHFSVTAFDEDGVIELLRALTGQPEHAPPPLGTPWTPPKSAPAERDRLIERTRRALTDPARLILPLQERSNLHQVFLPAVHSALADPAIVAVHADAGMGKSVLLGQIYDGLSAHSDIAVVLVSASAKTAERPRTVIELDTQFGDAVGRPGPLSALVAMQRAMGFRPVVLLDTLDLILDAASTPTVSQWLRSLVDQGVPVVLTCRTFEFRTHLEPLSERAPLLATLVDRKEIHRLTIAETTAFATAYLNAQPDTDRSLADRFVERLLHLRAQRQAVVEVCGSPLLLALACRLYAPTGEVPEDLTVARLFDSYWRKHVLSSPRHALNFQESDERQRTCMAGGAQLLAKSTTTFTEDFEPATMENVPRAEVIDRLCSDGVLVPGTDATSFRFFHQSFAEWVIARHVAVSDADRTAFVTALTDPVRRGYLAPVLVQLLYALDDDATYRDLVATLDLDELLCFRAVALSAVVRDDLHQLTRLVRHARTRSPQHQQHLVEAMSTASETLSAEMLDLAVQMCEWVDDTVVFAVAKAMGDLMARVPGDRTTAVEQALDAACRRRRTISDASRGDNLVQVVLRGLDPPLRPLTDPERAVLRARYPTVGPLGRAEIIRQHLDASPAAAAELLAIAVANRLPPQSIAAAVGVATVVGEDTDARDRLGWRNWRAMLSSRYAHGWDEVQVGLLAQEIVREHDATLTELLDLCVTDDKVLAERALFVARTVTQLSPDTVVDLLTSTSPPGERRRAGLVRVMLDAAPSLDHASAAQVIDWLAPVISANRGVVLQAMLAAATGHSDLVVTALDHGSPMPRAELAKVAAAALNACPAAERESLYPVLSPLATGNNEMAGRVAGTFAPTHADMRRRCTTLVLAAETRPALAAANQLNIVATARRWFDAELARQLLASPTSGAILHVARWIAACHSGALPVQLATAVTAALDVAESPDTADALWQLVINDVRMAGPLLADATTLVATAIDLAAPPLVTTRGGDPVADLSRVRMRAVLEVLLLLLKSPVTSDEATVALRTLIITAFATLPLEALDDAATTVRRLIIRSSSAFRSHGTAVLDELLAEFPGLSGPVQLGIAMATRQERGATSQEFRALAHRTTDPATRGYVVSHLA